ncbi:MAG TPA: sigma-70 family RNA polymerase sigma factor [Nannocystaceae bacterium]|nr:sigma-70 family RNA polymerase sigma factor [Nannocystaceae bacterium]
MATSDDASDTTATIVLEHALFVRWRDGDVRAGTELARRVDPLLNRYFARRFTGDIRDLVQRTWLAMIEAKLRFRMDCPFRAFCLATARNIMREEIRRLRRCPPIDEPMLVPTAIPDPVDELERAEVFAQLDLVLDGLDARSAEVVRLFYWEDTCGRKIGIQLAIPESSVRSRLRRAKQRIADDIGEHARELYDAKSRYAGTAAPCTTSSS